MSTNIEPTEGVAASIHDAGVMLLHTVKGRLFASNHIGARIWQGLEQRLPVQTIAAEISREYRIPRETALDHIVRFLAELEGQRLVERRVDQ